VTQRRRHLSFRIMSILGVEQHRSRRGKKPSRYHRALHGQPLSAHHPNQILVFLDWCRLNGLSERTGRRILTSGNGPVITQLSPNRFGITVANNAAWQRTRERASPLPPAQTLPRRRRQPASPQKRRARATQTELQVE
jgi:hypothetical protein